MERAMPPTKLTCVDCGLEFLYDEREAAFFKEKGWDAPKRCRDCRRAKKQEREARGQKAE